MWRVFCVLKFYLGPVLLALRALCLPPFDWVEGKDPARPSFRHSPQPTAHSPQPATPTKGLSFHTHTHTPQRSLCIFVLFGIVTVNWISQMKYFHMQWNLISFGTLFFIRLWLCWCYFGFWIQIGQSGAPSGGPEWGACLQNYADIHQISDFLI